MASMTVGDILRRARDQLSESSLATGFWQDRQMFDYVYDAQVDFCVESDAIVKKKTLFTTVTGTREYSIATDIFRVLALYYDSYLTQQVDFKELAVLSNNDNYTSTVQARAEAYYIYGVAGDASGTIGFYPLPEKSAPVMAVFSALPATNPSSYTTSTALEVPIEHARMLQDYVLYRSWAKEATSEGIANSRFYKQMWDEGIMRVKRLQREKYTGDRFAVVKDINRFFNTNFGII